MHFWSNFRNLLALSTGIYSLIYFMEKALIFRPTIEMNYETLALTLGIPWVIHGFFFQICLSPLYLCISRKSLYQVAINQYFSTIFILLYFVMTFYPFDRFDELSTSNILFHLAIISGFIVTHFIYIKTHKESLISNAKICEL
jgi:hypothetical protein